MSVLNSKHCWQAKTVKYENSGKEYHWNVIFHLDQYSVNFIQQKSIFRCCLFGLQCSVWWYVNINHLLKFYQLSNRKLFVVFSRRTLPFFSRILISLNFDGKVANNCPLRNLSKPGYQRKILKNFLFSAWSFITTVNNNVSFTFNPFLLPLKSQIFSHIFKQNYFSRKWS